MNTITIERKLDLLINLIEKLPQRMCNEFENREDVKKAVRLIELQNELQFYHAQNHEIIKSSSYEDLRGKI